MLGIHASHVSIVHHWLTHREFAARYRHSYHNVFSINDGIHRGSAFPPFLFAYVVGNPLSSFNQSVARSIRPNDFLAAQLIAIAGCLTLGITEVSFHDISPTEQLCINVKGRLATAKY